MAKKEKKSAVIQQAEKLYGKGILQYLDGAGIQIERLSTGSLKLDAILGGGLPFGRIIEFYGAETSGKTSLALNVLKEAQEIGLKCCFIDAEHSLDVDYCKNLKIKTDELLLSQPDYGEQGLEILQLLVQSGEHKVFVVDSVSALIPRNELEGDIGDAPMASQARMMSQAMRKLTGIIAKQKAIVIFINQIRSNIGGYGSGIVTSGGKALKFYSTVRLEIWAGKKIINNKKEIIGAEPKIKVVKNKTYPPYKETTLRLIFGKGLDYGGEILELALEHDILKMAGSWLKLGEENIAQGKEKSYEIIFKDEKLFREIERQVKEVLGIESQGI